MSSAASVTNARRLLDAISSAFAAGDWVAFRALYHDDARISSVAAGERILGPDDLIEMLSQLDAGTYTMDTLDTEVLDEDAVLVSGLVRGSDEGGTTYAPSAWVLTFRDGLAWRSKAYGSAAEGRAAYAEHGAGLGIP